jgi:hypothetical protein
MSLYNRIYESLTTANALTTLTGTKIYPQHRPQNDGTPSVVYRRISGNREITLGEKYVGLENPRVEIKVFATAIDARRVVADAVVTALEDSTRFEAISAMSPYDEYDPGKGEYTRVLDFSIWNHE